MIAIYVWFRFEWQYAVGAFVATGHDVFVTAGLYSLMQLDFTLTSVAALLTLAGYSVNDTVVVFDRIRENRRRYKRMSLRDLINLSTNQVLHRTVLTSVTTSISIIPLLLFGGPTLFDFTAAISVRHRGWNVLFHLRCGSIVAVPSADHRAGGDRRKPARRLVPRGRAYRGEMNYALPNVDYEKRDAHADVGAAP